MTLIKIVMLGTFWFVQVEFVIAPNRFEDFQVYCEEANTKGLKQHFRSQACWYFDLNNMDHFYETVSLVDI